MSGLLVVLPRLKLFVLAMGVVVEVLVVTLITMDVLDIEVLLIVEFAKPDEDLEDTINTAVDEGLMLEVGFDDMLVTVGIPVDMPAGMQRDPPQESPTGQQAVTPLKTQVGCAALHITEQRPTPPDEKQAAPEGQQPEPSGHTVSVAWAHVN
jgi:hypothetical protein